MKEFPSVLESIKDLSVSQIEVLLSMAKGFKGQIVDGIPAPFLKRPIVATSFLENSTRTKHSFTVAIKGLGATYIDFNADTSSLKKGEGLEETLITLKSQGVDCCLIRTGVSNQFSGFKKNPPIKIINCGDGTNQHPTQALLDLFTMQEIGFEFKGKTIAIIGDCEHSRVGHSLLDLLPLFGIKIIFCGPENYLPKNVKNEMISVTTDLDEAISKSDLLYLLRIQKERHSGNNNESIYQSYHQKYGLTLEKFESYNKAVPIFHPGPCNVGVEISEDLLKSKYYFGYEQVINSIPMRMAIIQAVLQNGDKEIGNDYRGRTLQSIL